jgi:hypothetical protein
MFFMRALMVDFGILRLMSFLMECLCMAPLTPAMMVVRGVAFPSIVLYGINKGVVFGVFVCEGLATRRNRVQINPPCD